MCRGRGSRPEKHIRPRANTVRPYKGCIYLTNLLEYLESAAERFPDKLAFADVNDRVTFAELRDLSQQLGAVIASQVNETCRPIAVLTTHTVADVVAFMAALYAGCFYVPIDGAAPEAHIAARLEAINPAMVIRAKTISELPICDKAPFNKGGVPQERGIFIENPQSANADSSLVKGAFKTAPAYAIFTSGSTGTPKAALISHESVINLIEWMCDEFGFNERTVFAGQAPFYFDSSVQELYSTLKAAATTHLFPRKYFISPLKVLKMVDEVGANVMPWAAAAIKLIANSGAFEKYVPSVVANVIFGGENMPAKILNIWRGAMPNTQFTNVYGPTETTVDCSYYTVERDLDDSESVPIGFPVRNTELLLLDEEFNPTPPNEPGELYVRGIQVGLGYYNNPERTNEVFLQSDGGLMYKTGDIVKLNELGELVFLARADNQVKHMGSRVELGEVETAAAAVAGVRLVCCSYDKEKAKILMFFEGDVSEKELSKELNAKLPRYMQPNFVAKVDKMPAMSNGKIDRITVRRVHYDENQ